MSVPSSELGWGGPDEREWRPGIVANIMVVATGLCLASLSAATCALALASLAIDRDDRSTSYPDFDL